MESRNDGSSRNLQGRAAPDALSAQSSFLNLTRQSIRVATWNVLTLNHPGHSSLLSSELSRLNVAVAGLQEVRWISHGETDVDNYRILWSGHETNHIQGVALAIHSRYTSSIVSWKPISARLLYARIKHSFGHMSVFSCYAPTDIADAETKDTFYQQLQDELRRVSRHDVIVLLGDMNATIGQDRSGLEHVLGPHSSSTDTNDNGDRMLELCASHNLKVLGTWFKHRQIHQTTWYSNTGTISKCIDHILVSGRWRVASDCSVSQR